MFVPLVAAAIALTPVDVQRFFDARMPGLLHQGDVAGAVVTVVKGDEFVFAKGYGEADLARHTPVSPESTLFRPGSISKLFTWTAVMQLVEQGRLDLDTDINAYLDFAIPATFPQPVTLRTLMTHTAGFEDVSKDLFVESPKDLYPLRDYLRARMPARVNPPGQIVAYSNYGTALAGYIVQRVSGEAYAAYIRDHILRPLGMHHSSMLQPLPADLAASMSQGYVSKSAGKPQAYELVEAAPAGAMATTALDIAQFMIAHLNGGASSTGRILEPASIERMHRHQYAAAPGRNGFTLGFFEEDRNGLRIIGHDGDTLFFHSDLRLLLDEKVGVFVSLNSAGNGLDIRSRLAEQFLDRYFPDVAPEEQTATTALVDARRVAGWYETSRRNQSVLGLSMVSFQQHVVAHPDGTIDVPVWGDFDGAPKRWREVGPLVYRKVGGATHLSFVADSAGHILRYVTDDASPIEVFERVPTLRTRAWLQWCLPAAALVLLLGLVGSVAYARRWPRKPAIWIASRLGATCLLAAAIGWPTLMWKMAWNLPLRTSGAADPWLYALYVTSVAGLCAIPIIALDGALWFKRRNAGVAVAIDAALLCAAAYLAWFIASYHLASFSVRY